MFKRFWCRTVEGWMSFWRGKPCPKHPGHRDRELDLEIETGCAMMPNMCSECWAEEKEKYGL